MLKLDKGYGNMVKKKNDELKKVPLKNYLIALLVLIGGILLIVYIFEWYQVKETEKYMESYLLKSNTITNSIDDINLYNQVIQEAPNDYFIVIGYSSDEQEYLFEKKLKEIIDDYELNDIVYYIDVTKLKEEENYLEIINNNLNVSIKNVPAIIFVKNRSINNDNIITKDENGNINLNDFEKILEIYEYEKQK